MRYTPGIINDTAVVLEDGKIATVEEICLKLNDYGNLLAALEQFDKYMNILNSAANYEDVWYQIPDGLKDAWFDSAVLIRGTKSSYRLKGK